MHKYKITVVSSTIVDAENAEDACRLIIGATSVPATDEDEARIQEKIFTGAEITEVIWLDTDLPE